MEQTFIFIFISLSSFVKRFSGSVSSGRLVGWLEAFGGRAEGVCSFGGGRRLGTRRVGRQEAFGVWLPFRPERTSEKRSMQIILGVCGEGSANRLPRGNPAPPPHFRSSTALPQPRSTPGEILGFSPPSSGTETQDSLLSSPTQRHNIYRSGASIFRGLDIAFFWIIIKSRDSIFSFDG